MEICIKGEKQMNNLQLIKSEKFGEVECDIYSNKKEMFMTNTQLGECLGYSNPRISIGNIVNRNEYLKDKEFSAVIKMITPSGEQETRIFTEDGIYEITMLAKTEKAKEFRAFIRKLLKSLRKGEAKLIKPSNEQMQLLEIKKKNADARLRNAKVREAKFLLEAVDKYKNVLAEQSVELLTINALEVINGKNTLDRPKLPEGKYYSATEIGDELGITANKVGKIANANNLKTDEYGKTVLSKSLYGPKQCPTFIYNEKGKNKIKELLGGREDALYKN
ncbi:MAG: hypothetical protein HFJ30_10280 [Clostridia bacterium]|nr:hypothetical protein [Clostridia bacterium]